MPRHEIRVAVIAVAIASLVAIGLAWGQPVLVFAIALFLPSLIQALRGRIGPIESVRRFARRLSRKGVDGWDATHAGSSIGPHLVLRGNQPLTGFLCEVEGPGGTYQAQSYVPRVVLESFDFPSNFVAEDGSQPPPFHRLPRGMYWQVWWAFDPAG